MSRFILHSDRIRRNAMQAIADAPDGYVVTVAEAKRSGEQNNLLWALLTEIAQAKPEGRQWTPETWKSAFMHFLGHQVMFAEGLDGSGPFPLGFRSSQLTKKQMTDLIECIYAYGAEHGVAFSHEQVAA